MPYNKHLKERQKVKGLAVYRMSPRRFKKGARFKTLKSMQYADKTFPEGSTVTFLGYEPNCQLRIYMDYYLRFPHFQFDEDQPKNRILDFEDLQRI